MQIAIAHVDARCENKYKFKEYYGMKPKHLLSTSLNLAEERTELMFFSLYNPSLPVLWGHVSSWPPAAQRQGLGLLFPE